MCLSRRPKARSAEGDGAASAAPSALPPTCIKDKHTFYSQLPNLDGFERGFRSDFWGGKSPSFFQFDSETVSCVLEGITAEI